MLLQTEQKVCWVSPRFDRLEWGTVKKMSTNLPKTSTGSTSSACECLPCAISPRSERRGSLLSTPQEEPSAALKPGQQPPKSRWLWRQNLCEGKKMWNGMMVIISSSVSCYSTKRPRRSLLTDSKMPEAGMAGSRGGAGCRSCACEANPTVLHNDIWSPGQHSQMAKPSLLTRGAFVFSFKKRSREIWILRLWQKSTEVLGLQRVAVGNRTRKGMGCYSHCFPAHGK